MSRAEIKLQSREALRNADPKGWILVLAIMLLSGAVSQIFDFVFPVALGVPLDYVAGEISAYNIPEWKLWAVDILSMVGVLIVAPFMLGFYRWALNTVRSEDNGSFSIIFFGFREKSRLWQYILMTVLCTMLYFGIYLVIYISALILLAIITLGSAYIIFSLAALLIIFVMIAVSIILVYRWRMAGFIMAEDEQIGAMKALKASAAMLKGNKWRMFVFDLSFIPWILLICCTFGLASFWVSSYIIVANANFYRKLIGEIPAPPAAIVGKDAAVGIEIHDTQEIEIPSGPAQQQTSYEAYLQDSKKISE